MELLQQNRREKHNSYNSLVGLIQSLINRNLLIEINNNVQVAGTLDYCDGFLNLSLKNVVVIDINNETYGFNDFMIRKRTIRYIHIPNDVSIIIFSFN